MKIYFTAAIIYKKKLGSVYLKIVDILEKAGHQVISEHILKESIPHILSQNDVESVKYYKKCLKNIKVEFSYLKHHQNTPQACSDHPKIIPRTSPNRPKQTYNHSISYINLSWAL